MKLWKSKEKTIEDEKKKLQTDDWAKSRFTHAVIFAKSLFDKNESIEYNMDLLDYLMETVKVDLQYDYLSKYFYEKDKNSHFFPLDCYNENGEEISLDTKEYRKVSLKSDVVVSFPWDRARTQHILPAIKKEGFCFMESGHKGCYVKGLDFSYIVRGNHSIASGIFLKQGIIELKILDIPLMYPHVDTDGVNWINVYTGEKITTCSDFRICILYVLGKMKYDYAAKQQL